MDDDLTSDELRLSFNLTQSILRRNLQPSESESTGEALELRCSNNRHNNMVAHLHEEYDKIKRRLDDAFVLKLNSAAILIGNSMSVMNALIQSVLRSYEDRSYIEAKGTSCYVVKVHGSLHSSDQDAIIYARDRLYSLRAEHPRDGTVAIDDLESRFRQCKTDGTPAVLVVEDIHVFAAHTRQTFLYTLLDLMHNKDCLFVVSPSCDD